MLKIFTYLEEPNFKYIVTQSFILINIIYHSLLLRNTFKIFWHIWNGQKWWFFMTELHPLLCEHRFKMLNISTDLDEPNLKSTGIKSFILIRISYHFLLLQNSFRIFCHIWNGQSQYFKWSKMMIPEKLPSILVSPRILKSKMSNKCKRNTCGIFNYSVIFYN